MWKEIIMTTDYCSLQTDFDSGYYMNWVVEFFMLNYNRMMGNGYGMLFRLAKT
jgi:hypothetical protein